jgi:hypothetical protein
MLRAAKAMAIRTKAKGYDALKEYKGRQYTGMKIGRGHTWDYDAGPWKETKQTPDVWTIHYAVTKRRRGHAPKGSGVPVGTEYNWTILAQQTVRKLNANDYTTELNGLKFKLAHKRADKGKWSVSGKGQQKRLVKFLHTVLEGLEREGMDVITKEAEAMPLPRPTVAKEPVRAKSRVRVRVPTSRKTRKRRSLSGSRSAP